MAQIEKLKPGDRLYDVHRQRMGNTNRSRLAWWPIVIKSVDLEKGTVVASWNGNPARTYQPHQVRRWKLSIPKKLAEEQGIDTKP